MKLRTLALALCSGAILIFSVAAGDNQAAADKEREQQRQEREAFFAKQRQENEAFRKTLKDMTPEQRAAAVKAHRDQQYAEAKQFIAQQHTENMAFLKERLAKVKGLTDAEKDELIAFCEQQYGEAVSFRDQRHQDAINQLMTILGNQSLSKDQKKSAIQDLVTQWKEKTSAFWQKQQSENKSERQKLRGEAKAGKAGKL